MPMARAFPTEFGVCPCEPADIPALGKLDFASCPPGVACATLADYTAAIRATFRGDSGELLHRAPWPDTPEYPFRDGHYPEAIALCRTLGFREWRGTCETD